jgi:hypothetical protein
MSISGDSPSTNPGAASPRRPTGRLQRLLVGASAVLAVAAFVLAATATVIAVRTADRVEALATPTADDDDSRPLPGDAPTVEVFPTPERSEPTRPPDVVPPADPTAQPTLDAQTQYRSHYPQQPLTLRTSGNNSSMSADLDEPRADVTAGADITLRAGFSNASGNLVLGRDVRGSLVPEPGLTPHDCSEQIRIAPLGAEAQVPVRQGVVLCLWTSRAAAIQAGIPQLVVLLEITGVAADGAVTLRLDAWQIPG